MPATPTEVAHEPTTKVLDWNAEVRKLWGSEYNKPTTSYEFSNGRKFELRTEDAGIYL